MSMTGGRWSGPTAGSEPQFMVLTVGPESPTHLSSTSPRSRLSRCDEHGARLFRYTESRVRQCWFAEILTDLTKSRPKARLPRRRLSCRVWPGSSWEAEGS